MGVSKIRHVRSRLRLRLGAISEKDNINDSLAGGEGSISTRDSRRSETVSRHRSERSRFGSRLRPGKDVEMVRPVEDVPLYVKDHSNTYLKEKGSGSFVGFLPYDSEINEENSQECLLVVVQSNTDRLVLPLPSLPPPIESFWSIEVVVGVNLCGNGPDVSRRRDRIYRRADPRRMFFHRKGNANPAGWSEL